LEEQGARILRGERTRLPEGEEDPTGNSIPNEPKEKVKIKTVFDLISEQALAMGAVAELVRSNTAQIEGVKEVVTEQGKKIELLEETHEYHIARILPDALICQDECRVAVADFVNSQSIMPDGTINKALRDRLFSKTYEEGYRATGVRGSKGRSKLQSHNSEQCMRFLHHLYLATNYQAFLNAYNRLGGVSLN
jgi:hypothetical protein